MEQDEAEKQKQKSELIFSKLDGLRSKTGNLKKMIF